MLYKNTDRPTAGYDAGVAVPETERFDLRWMIAAVLQRRWFVVMGPLMLMALAALFVLLRPPSYTASTQLQLTNLRLTFSREDAFFAETHPDPAFLETQIQIIRSDRVALSVLNNLKLIAADASAEQKAAALEKLRRGFLVDRAGLSNVVDILYTAPDPVMAARVADEFARAYIAELNAARIEAAQAGSSWLRDRLREVGPKARIIAEALPPIHKSGLRGFIIILGAGVLGGGLGVATAIAWKLVDRRVGTPEEVVAATGTECLGAFPRVPKSATENVARAAATEEDVPGGFSVSSPLLAYALDHPMSEGWQTLHNVKAACQDCFAGKGLKYLGITSTFAGEGRSTIATNLALALAAMSKRVLLVDADVYNPRLTRELASEDDRGLMDYIEAEHDVLVDYISTEHQTGLHFLPLGRGIDGVGSSIWTDRLQRFFDETGPAYDYVIFDMPTLGMFGDIRPSARFVEGFLLVIGWRHVSAENIQVGMRSAGAVHDRLLGSVLNRVDAKAARWSLSPQTAFSRRQQNVARLTQSAATVDATGQSASTYSKAKKWAVRLLLLVGVTAALLSAII